MTSRFSVPTSLIGCGAGLASGLLFASLIGASALALPLFLLSPLPLFIGALGWGTRIGALAGAVMLATVWLTIGAPAAITALLAVVVPSLLVCHLLGLARPAAIDPATGAAAAVEWYPLGRVLIAGSTAIALGTIIGGIAIGFDPIETSTLIADAFREQMAGPDGVLPSSESLLPFVRATVRLMPAFVPASWLLAIVFVAWLAAKALARSGHMVRPGEDLAMVRLPAAAGLVFAAALALAFGAGPVGLIASVVAGVLFAAHFLVGLGVLHVATRGSGMRPIILAVVYGLILLFTVPAALIVLAGVLDPFFGLRRRDPPRPSV